MKTALGIRFYEENPQKLKSLETFIRDVSDSVDLVFIIINDDVDKTGAYQYIQNLKLPKVETFLMNIWGKFTPALNAITYSAALKGMDRLVFCSPEMGLASGVISRLHEAVDDSTLVAGARLPGHEYNPGEHIATGTTIPWNTLAMWNVRLLLRTGFILLSDMPLEPSMAGIEEMATCAVQYKLYHDLKIKLVDMPGTSWNTDDLSQIRKNAHTEKIRTKNIRAASQLAYLHLPAPRIIHC